ncbi:MAG: VTC domain-containing protein, partial [Actinomycetota bacterium]|nr:VTC domain-containing protein [Actinomycetota bacterium]
MTEVERAAHELPAISLAETEQEAALQARVDRKYVVDGETAVELVQFVGSAAAHSAVLEIEGRREFTYESVYFDTPDRVSYLAAAHRRRRRFKVRTRRYADSATAAREVKTRGGRGETVKL